MPKCYDYGYDFDFPREYHPGNTANAADYYFCKTTFEKYIETIQTCVFHVKGPLTGTPFILEKWEKDIIAALFCLIHKETGRRRYREALIYMPRKNGKSMFCSGLVIGYLVVDEEKGKQVVSAAGSADQAALIYKPVRVSLKNVDNPLNSPENTEPSWRFNVKASPRMIISEDELNEYLPVTADGERNHGLNASMSIMDELHAWREKQGGDLYEAIETSMDARFSPLNIIITTADTDGDSMCNRKFDFAQEVCDGRVDDETFLPVLYYLDKTEDWKDEKNWYKCNPQLGISVSIENIREKFKKALREPGYTNSFKRLRLNMQTRAVDKFLDFPAWDKSKRIKIKKCHGLKAFGGLDMSYKHDLCAFVLEVPLPKNKIAVFTMMWIPEKHPHIEFYEKRNWKGTAIKVTPGAGIDFKMVRDDIAEMCNPFKMVEIGYDPRFATQLCQDLYNDPFNLPMMEVPQTPNFLSEALNDIAVVMIEDRFKHDGNKCAAWQVGNATKKDLTSKQIQLVKPKGKEATAKKVDFVAALSIAHSRYLFSIRENINELIKDENYSIF